MVLTVKLSIGDIRSEERCVGKVVDKYTSVEKHEKSSWIGGLQKNIASVGQIIR